MKRDCASRVSAHRELQESGDARLSVRRATPADAPEIAAVKVLSWRAAYADLLPADYLESMQPEHYVEGTRSRLAADHPALADHLLLLQDRVIGWSSSVFPARGLQHHEAAGELCACYLLPEFWGRGWGRRLLVESLSFLSAQGAVRCVLWILGENQRAMGFYHKLGFTLDGEQRTLTLREDIQRRVLRMQLPLERG